MFTVEGLRINFYHEDASSFGGVVPHAERFSKITTCEIVKDGDNDDPETVWVISLGESFCLRGDNFSRSDGRKRALTRALEVFDRELRTRVWKKYWTLVKK